VYVGKLSQWSVFGGHTGSVPLYYIICCVLLFISDVCSHISLLYEQKVFLLFLSVIEQISFVTYYIAAALYRFCAFHYLLITNKYKIHIFVRIFIVLAVSLLNCYTC